MSNKSFQTQYHSSLVVLYIFFALIFSGEAYAQNVSANKIAPDKEKRSCIQTVDGYAYLSEDMTLAETRAAAFINAKRQALEMARTYITSKTKVANFVLKYDLIWTVAEGSITILDQKDYGVEDNSRYHVWIKADVEYELRPKKHDYVISKEVPLTVKVWTPKKHYKEGENIEVYIQGNHDFYARVVDIMPGGEIIQLLPNVYREINFFKAEKIYKIPDKGDRFDLKVTAPYGSDRIVVYACEVPLGRISMNRTEKGLYRFMGSRKELATTMRGIKVVSGIQGAHSGAEFYEATWTLTTGR